PARRARRGDVEAVVQHRRPRAARHGGPGHRDRRLIRRELRLACGARCDVGPLSRKDPPRLTLPSWPADRPLRAWQEAAAAAVFSHPRDAFLASATPAAGKTTFG